MNNGSWAAFHRINLRASLSLFLLLSVGVLRADQVEMKNGDRYVGKVISMSTNLLFLQSEVLGTLRLPREKIASINLGTSTTNKTHVSTTTNRPLNPLPSLSVAAPATPASTNGMADINAALRQLGADTNLIRQVQSQFLSGAGEDANAKFNELMGGLISGKVDVNGLRSEAKAAADQLRSMQDQLGSENSASLAGYLSVLDSFLQQTDSATNGATNAAKPTRPAQPKPPK